MRSSVSRVARAMTSLERAQRAVADHQAGRQVSGKKALTLLFWVLAARALWLSVRLLRLDRIR